MARCKNVARLTLPHYRHRWEIWNHTLELAVVYLDAFYCASNTTTPTATDDETIASMRTRIMLTPLRHIFCFIFCIIKTTFVPSESTLDHRNVLLIDFFNSSRISRQCRALCRNSFERLLRAKNRSLLLLLIIGLSVLCFFNSFKIKWWTSTWIRELFVLQTMSSKRAYRSFFDCLFRTDVDPITSGAPNICTERSFSGSSWFQRVFV